jgi:plastocyanin
VNRRSRHVATARALLPALTLPALPLLALTPLALTLLVSGCGQAPAAAPAAPVTAAAVTGADGVQRITVTGDDALQFTPSTVTAHRGRLVITFTVVGSSPHTLGVEDLDAETGNVNAHTSRTLTVDLTAAGDYELECDYHPLMRGRLVVS